MSIRLNANKTHANKRRETSKGGARSQIRSKSLEIIISDPKGEKRGEEKRNAGAREPGREKTQKRGREQEGAEKPSPQPATRNPSRNSTASGKQGGHHDPTTTQARAQQNSHLGEPKKHLHIFSSSHLLIFKSAHVIFTS